MAKSAETQIPKGPGDYIAPAVLKDPEMNTAQKIVTMAKDYAVGAIKGITTDLAGTPVDLMNLLISPATKALGIYSDNPVGGSKDLRARAGVGVEDANLRETVGNLLTPGGIAHAMIVGAARVGRDTGKAAKMVSDLIAEGKSVQEAEGRAFAATGVYADKTDIFKTVISDATGKFMPNAVFVNKAGDYADLNAAMGRKLSKVYSDPKLFTAYPELKDILTRQAMGQKTDTASYTGKPGKPIIELAPGSSEKKLRETLLHEIQHAIQDIENFSFKGSNPAAERKFSETVAPKLNNIVKLINEKIAKGERPTDLMQGYRKLRERFELDRQNAYPSYRNNPGEQEATFTESVASLSQEEVGQKVLDLILSGKSPQTWNLQPLTTAVRTK